MQTASTIDKSKKKKRRHKKKKQQGSSNQIQEESNDSKPAPLSLKKKTSQGDQVVESQGCDSSDFSNQDGSGSYSISDESSDNSEKGQKLRLSDFDQDDQQMILPAKSSAI